MNIVVYSAPDCSKCDMVKSWLKYKSIPFEEINVREDVEAANLLKEMRFRSIPQIFKNGNWVADDKNYREALI